MRHHHWHDQHEYRVGDGQPDAVRAANADREAMAERLRTHHAEGRLSDDEFQQRLEQSMDARTLGDLRALGADLPAEDPRGSARVGPGRGWRHGPIGLRLLPVLLLFTIAWGAIARHAAWHHGYPGPYGHAGPGFPWPLLLVVVAGFAVLHRRRRFLARRTRWA